MCCVLCAVSCELCAVCCVLCSVCCRVLCETVTFFSFVLCFIVMASEEAFAISNLSKISSWSTRNNE